MIEPLTAAGDDTDAAEVEVAVGEDQPLLLWQLFFPMMTRYEGAGLPASLEQRLRVTSAATTNRVLVSAGTRGLRNRDLQAYGGVVIVGARGSLRQLRRAGFAHVYRCLALPSPANPRWLLPADQASMAATFTLPRMYRLSSRAARAALIAALRFGTLPWRARTVTVAARREPALFSAIRPLFPQNDLRLAFAAGTPGPMRKPGVVCFQRGGPALAYGKVGISPVSETLVRNEARMLRRIAATPRLLPVAPRLLLEGDCDGRTVAVVTALGGSGVGARFGRAQRRFLDALQGDPAEPVFANPFLLQLGERVNAREEEALRHVFARARTVLANAELPPALMHGDCAPWNMRRSHGAIAAFDWEYGVIHGLPVLDEMHYRWHTRLLLDHRRPQAVLHELDQTARARSGLDAVQSGALVDVFLVHGVLHRLEMGCSEEDGLVKAYRAALQLRVPAKRVKP